MQDLYKNCYDNDSELFFLGCFCSNEINPFPTLVKDDFGNTNFGRLYAAFVAGDFAPTVTNFERYRVERDLWLSVLESVGSDAQGGYHGTKIARLSAIRKGIRLRIEEAKALSEHITEDRDKIDALVGATGSSVVIKDARMMAMGAISAFEASRNGFRTPFVVSCVHCMIRAWSPGEQWIIAAGSGVGKTSLAMQLCEGYRTLFISGEMPELGLDRRYHGMEYWQRADNEEEFGFTANEENQEIDFKNAQSDGRVYRYFKDDWKYITRPMSLVEIDKAVAVAVREHGIEIFLIDYLQLMRGSGKDRRNDVAELARGTKQIAMKYGVRALLLSQVSRPVSGGMGANADPATIPVNLGRLKESGDIEESADGVIGMWLHRSRDTNIQVVQDIKNRQLGVHQPKYLKRIGPYLRTAKDIEVEFEPEYTAPAKKRFEYKD